MRGYLVAAAAVLTLGLGGVEARAATVFDPVDDFLPSYAGPLDSDLDVTSLSVEYDSATSSFLLGATLKGVIKPAKPGFYVIGVNTGAGAIAPFGAIGEPDVIFDQAIVVQKDGTGLVTGASGGALAAGAVTLVGNLFTARVPLALLPSTGAQPLRYGFNLWPRIGFADNSQISDFAPDNALIAPIPEPETWAMMVTGCLLAGGALRLRRRRMRLLPA